MSTFEFTLWFIIVGALLIFMAVAGSLLQRLPLSTSMLYLGAGVALGPAGVDLIRLDPIDEAKLLERVAEVAVIVSLFTAGLKLRTPLSDGHWWRPVRLASLSMVLTVAMIAVAGMLGLGLSLGAAILLGGILAPTDPVLASDVQVGESTDRDDVRFSLTGEAGLNDGSAFPFVMLGLGLLELREIGSLGWRWLAVDVLWAIPGGLAIGALLGAAVGRFVLYLRREHKEAIGLDDFLALGLIALSYGVALLLSTYAFLAVFAAGVALRRVEYQASGDQTPEEVLDTGDMIGDTGEIATHPEKAPAYMAQAVLAFNEQIERIGEVAIVLLVGGMLTTRYLPAEALWFLPLLFLVIRPLAVLVGLARAYPAPVQTGLMCWFGIRGIGSIYYLMYAIEHGVAGEQARLLTALVLTTVVVSVLLHGISVTPLMSWYGRKEAAD